MTDVKDSFSNLAKLIMLKRKKTEQDFLAAQLELNRLEAHAKRLVDRLKTIDSQRLDVAAAYIAHQDGYLQRLFREMHALRVEILKNNSEFNTKREALKRVLFADERIKRTQKRRN